MENLNEWQAKELVKKVVKGWYNEDCTPEVEQVRAELADYENETDEMKKVNDMSEKEVKMLLKNILDAEDAQEYLDNYFAKKER